MVNLNGHHVLGFVVINPRLLQKSTTSTQEWGVLHIVIQGYIKEPRTLSQRYAHTLKIKCVHNIVKTKGVASVQLLSCHNKYGFHNTSFQT